MGRLFNGTTDRGVANLNLSSFTLITVSFWAYIDSYVNTNKCLIDGTVGATVNGFFVWPDNSLTSGLSLTEIRSTSGGGQSWDDKHARASAANWHQFMYVFNRTGPLTKCYIDGAVSTISTVAHDPGPWGSFSNASISLFSMGSSTSFIAGRMADLAIWGGVELTSGNAISLAAGRRAIVVRSANLVGYWPMENVELASGIPDPDLSGAGAGSITYTGTTPTDDPTTLDPLATIRSETTFGGEDVAERVDAATIGSVSTFSGVDVYFNGISDASTINPITTFSFVEQRVVTDTGTYGSTTAFSGTELRIIVDAGTLNPKTTFVGLDHLCIYIPEFQLSGQSQYDVEEGNARTNYQLEVHSRFFVTGSFNPGSNPC